eukprot:scaffold202806_cov15-Tisochrysis_lutea.AAC.1
MDRGQGKSGGDGGDGHGSCRGFSVEEEPLVAVSFAGSAAGKDWGTDRDSSSVRNSKSCGGGVAGAADGWGGTGSMRASKELRSSIGSLFSGHQGARSRESWGTPGPSTDVSISFGSSGGPSQGGTPGPEAPCSGNSTPRCSRDGSTPMLRRSDSMQRLR